MDLVQSPFPGTATRSSTSDPTTYLLSSSMR